MCVALKTCMQNGCCLCLTFAKAAQPWDILIDKEDRGSYFAESPSANLSSDLVTSDEWRFGHAKEDIVHSCAEITPSSTENLRHFLALLFLMTEHSAITRQFHIYCSSKSSPSRSKHNMCWAPLNAEVISDISIRLPESCGSNFLLCC